MFTKKSNALTSTLVYHGGYGFMKSLEVEPKLGELLGHLLEETKKAQAGTPAPSLSLPVAGADGVQLQHMRQDYRFEPKRQHVQATVVLKALIDHLGLEVYVNEAEAQHPLVVRKAKR